MVAIFKPLFTKVSPLPGGLIFEPNTLLNFGVIGKTLSFFTLEKQNCVYTLCRNVYMHPMLWPLYTQNNLFPTKGFLNLFCRYLENFIRC